MNHWSSSEAQPAIFARLLAELVNRLRLSHVENLHHEPSWPICSRLAVQANLLGGLAKESDLEGLAYFAQTVTDLSVLGQEDPAHIPPSWAGALVRLADFLDEMMVGMDAGDGPDQWLDEARWERLTSWFAHLETPFLVMDEVEEVLLRWQEAWCDGSLDLKNETELQERWQRLREFGDALFDSPAEDDDSSLLRWKGFTP